MHNVRPVGSRLRLAAAVAILAAIPGAASAQTTLNFGTAGGFGNLQCVNNGAVVNLASYGGFNFAGLRSAQPVQFTGGCAATNSGLGTSATITALGGTAFNFQSARFADAFPTGGTTITLSGFLGATSVFSNTLTLGSSVGAGLLFTNTNSGAIDRLMIMQTGNDPFLIDDFTTQAAVSTVPEPGTWALLAVSLVALVPFARRKKQV